MSETIYRLHLKIDAQLRTLRAVEIAGDAASIRRETAILRALQDALAVLRSL